MTAKSQKARTFAQLHRHVARVTDFVTSLVINNVPTEATGRALGPVATHFPFRDKVRHVMRPRLLQSVNANPTVTAVTNPGKGYTYTLNNIFPVRNASSNQPGPGIFNIHQAYDLRASAVNQSNNTTMSASLGFQPNGYLAPNQITLLLPGALSQVTLVFSQTCVFPVAASSPSLAGINSTTGQVNPRTAPSWLNIFAYNAFEVSAAQTGFGKLDSGVPGNVSVSFPQNSKTAAEAQGLYSQTLTFNDTQSMRLIQIYCPLLDSANGSWSVNVTGSTVIGPVVVPSAANATDTTNNATSNGANDTSNATDNTTNNGNPSNTSNPDADADSENSAKPSSFNKTALIVGLVLGVVLIIPVIAVIYLCVKLSKKKQEIITDEGYGPNAGFKRFDEEQKVVTDYNTGLEIPTSNALPESQATGTGQGDTGFGWRQNETIVVAEDSNDRENPFGPPAKSFA